MFCFVLCAGDGTSFLSSKKNDPLLPEPWVLALLLHVHTFFFFSSSLGFNMKGSFLSKKGCPLNIASLRKIVKEKKKNVSYGRSHRENRFSFPRIENTRKGLPLRRVDGGNFCRVQVRYKRSN